jgi:hypothetical protein
MSGDITPVIGMNTSKIVMCEAMMGMDMERI